MEKHRAIKILQEYIERRNGIFPIKDEVIASFIEDDNSSDAAIISYTFKELIKIAYDL